jgi:3-phytase
VFDQATSSFVRQFGSKGEGPGQLQNPNGVAVGAEHVFVTDGSNHRVCVSSAP